MRVLVLVLAIVLSPVGLTLCQISCAATALADTTDVSVRSCHASTSETVDEGGAPAVSLNEACSHLADIAPAPATKSTPFQLAMATSAVVLETLVPVWLATPLDRVHAGTSPSPLFVPLRI